MTLTEKNVKMIECVLRYTMTLDTHSDFERVALWVLLEEEECGRIKKQGGKNNVKRNFNETAFGGRCTFRSPDKKMEP